MKCSLRAVPVCLLLLLGPTLSCSSVQTPEEASKPPRPRTTMEVRNQRPLDFNLYVLDGTHRIRLGTVPGMTTRIFTIPSHLVIDQGMLRFQIDPIGSQEVQSTDESIVVHEGERLSLTF
jgi:hypothetical protein